MKNIKKFFLFTKHESIKMVLKKIIKNGTRTIVVIDPRRKLLGTLTEGDIQRFLLKNNNINLKITKIYNKNPQKINLKMIKNHNLIEKFINKQIGLIPVVNNKNILQNVITWSEVFKAEKSKSELKKIDVVIMAGGKGERLKPYTDILPKPLIPVNSKPMLEHIIENFEYFHFRKFHLVLNHQAQLIKTYFQSKQKNYKINFIKEAKTLGTIGGLSLVKKISSDDILISNCDTLFKIDYEKFFDFHKKGEYFLTLIVSKSEHVFPYGACKINSTRLISLEEKPVTSFIANAGLYFAKKELTRLIPKNQNYNMNKLIEKCLRLKKKLGYIVLSPKPGKI